MRVTSTGKLTVGAGAGRAITEVRRARTTVERVNCMIAVYFLREFELGIEDGDIE